MRVEKIPEINKVMKVEEWEAYKNECCGLINIMLTRD